MRAILSELEIESEATLKDPLPANLWPGLLDRVGPTGVLRQVLTRWSQADPVPLVLLIDEIDTLIGDTLIAVLRQLRAGYPHRPLRFPQSVILCGVRDVRDYRIHSSTENAIVTGGSAFNIKAESLRIGDFPEAEVRALLGQHSADTGQPFSEDALQAVWELTAGQPWLANALAQQACFRDEAGRDRLQEITRDAIHAAREQLILRRETHLEQLTDKLSEERVRRVMGPVLSGSARRTRRCVPTTCSTCATWGWWRLTTRSVSPIRSTARSFRAISRGRPRPASHTIPPGMWTRTAP